MNNKVQYINITSNKSLAKKNNYTENNLPSYYLTGLKKKQKDQYYTDQNSSDSSDSEENNSLDNFDQRRTWNGDHQEKMNIYRPKHHPSTYINYSRLESHSQPNMSNEKTSHGVIRKSSNLSNKSAKTATEMTKSAQSKIISQKLSNSNDSIHVRPLGQNLGSNQMRTPLSVCRNDTRRCTYKQNVKIVDGRSQGQELTRTLAYEDNQDSKLNGRENRHSQDSGVMLCSKNYQNVIYLNKEESIKKYIHEANLMNKSGKANRVRRKPIAKAESDPNRISISKKDQGIKTNATNSSNLLSQERDRDHSFLSTLFQIFSWGSSGRNSTQIYSINEVDMRGGYHAENYAGRQKSDESSWIADWRSSLI